MDHYDDDSDDGGGGAARLMGSSGAARHCGTLCDTPPPATPAYPHHAASLLTPRPHAAPLAGVAVALLGAEASGGSAGASDDESSDDEYEMHLRDEDLLILTARNEDDVSHLEARELPCPASCLPTCRPAGLPSCLPGCRPAWLPGS
jgi:hypothetical protein